jgi:hypothetical protein
MVEIDYHEWQGQDWLALAYINFRFAGNTYYTLNPKIAYICYKSKVQQPFKKYRYCKRITSLRPLPAHAEKRSCFAKATQDRQFMAPGGRSMPENDQPSSRFQRNYGAASKSCFKW